MQTVTGKCTGISTIPCEHTWSGTCRQILILKDFRSYADAQKRVEEAYKDREAWSRKALMNVACCGKFSSDRTIQEYVDDIWHLDQIKVDA